MKKIMIYKILGGVYLIFANGYKVIFLTTRESIIVVDAPASIWDTISKAILKVTNEPMKYIIYSHTHQDNI